MQRLEIGVLKSIKKHVCENCKNPRLSGKSWSIEICGYKNRVFMQRLEIVVLKSIKKRMYQNLLTIHVRGVLKSIKKCMYQNSNQ